MKRIIITVETLEALRQYTFDTCQSEKHGMEMARKIQDVKDFLLSRMEAGDDLLDYRTDLVEEKAQQEVAEAGN